MSDLKSRLIQSANMWAVAHNAPLSRLGKQVAGDANFFARIITTDASFSLTTLDKFARFLGKPDNWPGDEDGRHFVPSEVQTFVHVTGVSIEGRCDHAA